MILVVNDMQWGLVPQSLDGVKILIWCSHGKLQVLHDKLNFEKLKTLGTPKSVKEVLDLESGFMLNPFMLRRHYLRGLGL